MNIKPNKTISIVMAACLALYFLVVLAVCRNQSVVTVWCTGYSAAYDYAVSCGYKTQAVYSHDSIDYDADAENFIYELDENGARITAYNGESTTVFIPELLGGESVYCIDSDTFNDMNITDIYIPKSVQKINCGFSTVVYDAVVRAALTCTAAITLVAVIILLSDNKKAQFKYLARVPLHILVALVAAAQAVFATIAVIAGLPALAVTCSGLLLFVILVLIRFISKPKKNSEQG